MVVRVVVSEVVVRVVRWQAGSGEGRVRGGEVLKVVVTQRE